MWGEGNIFVLQSPGPCLSQSVEPAFTLEAPDGRHQTAITGDMVCFVFVLKLFSTEFYCRW